MWKTLAVGCFFFWLVYSTIYFFTNKQELFKRDLEHKLEDAKSRVAILKNEILDISYQTDLLLRFQKENRRLLHTLKGISKKALRSQNGKGEDTTDAKMEEPEQEWLEEEAAQICDQEKIDLKEKMDRELSATNTKTQDAWIERNILDWEVEKIHRCEKERWDIFDKQQEGTWSPGDEKSPRYSCHWNYLNVVLQFPNVMGTDKPVEKKTTRQAEFNECLQKIAEHPAVEKVHLYYNKEEDLEPLKNIPYPFVDKIVPQLKPGPGEFIHYSQAFEFANKALKGKVVMVQNADVFPDSGFALLEDYHFRNSTRVFSLSRHEHGDAHDVINPRLATTVKCGTKKKANELNCEERKIVGSHDAFVFMPPLPADFIAKVDHQQNAWGAENVVVFELVKAGLKAFNPCSVLRIFHNHCSDARPRYTDLRVNKARSGIGTSVPRMLVGLPKQQYVNVRTADQYKSCVARLMRGEKKVDKDEGNKKTVIK